MSKDVDPNYLTEDDVEYIRQRPFLRREFILQGFGDPLDEDYPGLVSNQDSDANGPENPEGEDPEDGGDTNVQSDLPENQQWSDQMKSQELKDVIEARNADRDEDWQIVPQGTGQDGNLRKDDLFDALRADDQRIAEYRAQNPDE